MLTPFVRPQQKHYAQPHLPELPPFDLALAPLFGPPSPADDILPLLRDTYAARDPTELVHVLTSNASHHVAGIVTASEFKDIHRRSLRLLDELANTVLSGAALTAWETFLAKHTRTEGVDDSGNLLDRTWRDKAEEDERTANRLLERIDAVVEKHTPWQTCDEVPWNGIVWSSSISFLRTVVSLLATVCFLGYKDKPLEPRPSHETVRSRLADATAAATGGKNGWGRVAMNAVLPALRDRFKQEDSAVRSRFLSLVHLILLLTALRPSCRPPRSLLDSASTGEFVRPLRFRLSQRSSVDP